MNCLLCQHTRAVIAFDKFLFAIKQRELRVRELDWNPEGE